MNKKLITLIMIFALVLLLLCPSSIGKETINTHTITITEGTEYLEVTESLTILGDTDEYYDEISLKIPADSSDISIIIDGKEPNSINILPAPQAFLISGVTHSSTHICNLSGLSISKNTSVAIVISYKIEANADVFQGDISYDTDSLVITYKNEEIYQGSSLSKDTAYSVKLSKDTTTTITKETDTTMYLAIIGILIVLLIVLVLFSRKTRTTSTSPKPTDTKTASKEYLATKKEHLMESLKDIEKKHRAKKISDETYRKLKDRYKQEAVDTMKKLEDMK